MDFAGRFVELCLLVVVRVEVEGQVRLGAAAAAGRAGQDENKIRLI